MGKPYSIDLRERVVAAVETGGMSCHRAAAQFGVGVNTAIHWVRRFRQTGSVARDRWAGTSRRRLRASIVPGWWNGRRRRTSPCAGWLVELAERGLKVNYRTVWSFVHAEKLSFKKNRGGWGARSSRRRATAGAVGQVS